MTRTYWITKNPENGAFGGCISTHKPINAVAEAPMDGGQFPVFDDLDIQEVGGVVTVTVSATKKASRLKAQEDAKAAEGSRLTARESRLEALKALAQKPVLTTPELTQAIKELIAQAAGD